MKKLFALLLALMLLLSLAGCHPSQSLYVETTAQATEEATTEMLPDGPVILPTKPKPIDPEQAEQDRLNAEQDLWEAQQGLQGQQGQSQPGQTQVPSTQDQEDNRPRPGQDDQQDPYGQDDREDQPDTPDPTEAPTEEPTTAAPTQPSNKPYLDPNGTYKTKDEVALYIHLYGRLPSNYITKTDGNRTYGKYQNIPKIMNIGGDPFKNREGRLPSGRTYYECDIGTSGGSNRGAKRIVFSSTGWIYYTSDHYNSFTLLYKGS